MNDKVWQHAWCGTLVAIPEMPDWAPGGGYKPTTPGLCPNTACAHPEQDWWGQELPVGPLMERKHMPQRNWSKPTLLKRLAQTVLEVSPEAQEHGDTVEEIMLAPESTALAEMSAAELIHLIRSAVIVEAIKR